VCLRLPAYSASAKVICFIGKLGQRDRRISPDSGSLFQTIPNGGSTLRQGDVDYMEVREELTELSAANN
ncbi:hypothetical protein, partial [Stutzerimonas nitrititolerans]|uniref:hypothetical protein n=1 Tax=Stutzerimonas nitrititolerans TaxID=2482751 RepID=UPI0028B1E06D